MRIMTVLSAGCLFAGLIALTAVGTASAQEVYAPPAPPLPFTPALCTILTATLGFRTMPIGRRFTMASCRWPRRRRCATGRPITSAVPSTDLRTTPIRRPPLGYPGYAGFSGCDPNAYRTMVPPPIPTPSELPANPQPPTPAPEQLPAPPVRVRPRPKPIPTPPSNPAPK